MPDLLGAEHQRQPARPANRRHRYVRIAPAYLRIAPAQRQREEEAQGRDGCVHARGRGPDGSHVQLIAPQILRARLVRRAAEKAVKSLTARMYPVWVLGAKPRTVMSSIMRRHNGPPAGLPGRLPAGLMVLSLSVMGLLLSRGEVRLTPNLNRTDPARYRADLAKCRRKLPQERFSRVPIEEGPNRWTAWRFAGFKPKRMWCSSVIALKGINTKER